MLVIQGPQWLPSVAWLPAAPGLGLPSALSDIPGVVMGHSGRQGCLLESFHGGQLRDLKKSAEWNQLGIEAALPSSPVPLCLSPCLSLCPQEGTDHRATVGLTSASPGQLVAGPMSCWSGFILRVPT